MCPCSDSTLWHGRSARGTRQHPCRSPEETRSWVTGGGGRCCQQSLQPALARQAAEAQGLQSSILVLVTGFSDAKDCFPPYFRGISLNGVFTLGCRRSWLIFWLAFVSRQGCELLEVGTLRCGPFSQPLLKTVRSYK